MQKLRHRFFVVFERKGHVAKHTKRRERGIEKRAFALTEDGGL